MAILGVVFLFLAGLGVVAALMLLHLLAILCKHCFFCCCCPWFFIQMGAATTIDVDRHRGPVSRRAGLLLWGRLGPDERVAILETILKGMPYYIDRRNDTSSSDSEMTDTGDEVSTRANQSQDSNAGKEGGGEEADVELGNGGAEDLPDDDAQNQATCAICLSEYVQGEVIVTGTSCSHMFHKTCAVEWFLASSSTRQQDDCCCCPCCRKEMVTLAEMCATAERVLGRERVTKLSTTRQLIHPNSSDNRRAPMSSRRQQQQQQQQQQHPSDFEMTAVAAAGARAALAMAS